MASVDENKDHWEKWDWTTLGEEWTPDDPRWKPIILQHALEPYLERNARVLEIGPGGGRWTAEILKYDPTRLLGVDLTPRCIDLCRERFAGVPNVEFELNDGRDLSFVEDATMDFVWSFDVFVHIEYPEVDAYFAEFRRILAPGGHGVVHYASIDRATGADRRCGWRANFTSSDMHEILARHGLTILQDYFESWIAGENSSVVIFTKS